VVSDYSFFLQETSHLFPAWTVFWCLGVFKEAGTRKRLFFLFLFYYYTTGDFWRKLRRQLGQQTTSIATSMKLTGYHKPLCLHKDYKHSCTNQFIPITSELQRSAYWSEGPDHQGGGQLSRTPHIMSACIITSARHSASSVIIRRGPLRNSDSLV